MTSSKTKGNGVTQRQKKRFRFLWIAAPVLLAALAVTGSAWPQGSLAGGLIRSLGAIGVFAFIAGRSWSALYIGGQPDVVLVTDGPYRHMRNPLYFFSAMGLLGVGLLWQSLVLGGALFGFVLATFHFVIRGEEKFLEGRFGEKFRTYCKAVPRLVPALRPAIAATHGATTPFSPGDLRLFFRDASWLLLAIPASAVTDWMQRAGWLPVLFRLY